MIEKIVQILGMGWVILCIGCITWTIAEYIHLRFKNPKL
tara:strand:- start:473 stop:589 length:117 start_codon:yes stop_codon:yes gene_type:complete